MHLKELMDNPCLDNDSCCSPSPQAKAQETCVQLANEYDERLDAVRLHAPCPPCLTEIQPVFLRSDPRASHIGVTCGVLSHYVLWVYVRYQCEWVCTCPK